MNLTSKTTKTMDKEYRIIPLENGDYLQIKYEAEGIVYDKFDKDDEHVESYGYDFYSEIKSIHQAVLEFIKNQNN